MGGFFILRYIFSKKVTAYAPPFPAQKSVLKYILKRHFNAHRQASRKDARKLSKLPGVFFRRIMSNSRERCYHELIYAISCQWYAARAPPLGNLNNFNFQIFGGKRMNNSSIHKNFSKNFFNLESPPQGYPLRCFVRSSRKGVSA